MEILKKRSVDQYLADDTILMELDRLSTAREDELRCQKWRRESDAKRYIYKYLYYDLLNDQYKRVLDADEVLC